MSIALRYTLAYNTVMTKQQYADRKAQVARLDAAYAEAARIVATGTCPDCGAPLRHNLSILGWWQCAQYGAVGFRRDASKPACNFQTFTKQD